MSNSEEIARIERQISTLYELAHELEEKVASMRPAPKDVGYWFTDRKGDRDIEKIKKALPPADSANPVAELLNFCKDKLRVSVAFEYEGLHKVRLNIGGYSIGSFCERTKRRAKEEAARAGLAALAGELRFDGSVVEYSKRDVRLW